MDRPADSLLPAYRRHCPVLCFPFPWVTTATAGQLLDALVHREPWDRCGVEQRYFASARAVGDLCDKFCRFTAQITNAAQATATMEAVDEVEHANDLATVARPLVLE